MPARTPRKASTRKGKATPVAEPERFTADGKKIVKLQKLRSHQKYLLKGGTQVPGASTIAKLGDDGSSLIHWAWDLGNRGIDYRKARDQAADIGTIAAVNRTYAADGSWNVKVARKVAHFYQVISENHNAQLEKLK